jgi:ribose 5-phosphate isomerase RpiB
MVMKIAIVNEISAAERNIDILDALSGRGFEVLNLGNTSSSESQPLQYIHTGLLSALALHLNIADFVIGGCGTGIGFMNAVLQYPGVSCGYVRTPLDAWLFARINAGNCVSLVLNQGYGWAGEINLRMIFDALFTDEYGSGFPAHREEPQRSSRMQLAEISAITHKPFIEILQDLPEDITKTVLNYPAFRPILKKALNNYPQYHAIQSLM